MTRAELVAAMLTPGLLPAERREVESWHEEIGDGTDDCGGHWSDGGPCGGCTRCLHAQASYYIHQRADKRRRMAGAGLLVPPRYVFPPYGEGELPKGDWEGPRSCPTWAKPRPSLDARAGTVADG